MVLKAELHIQYIHLKRGKQAQFFLPLVFLLSLRWVFLSWTDWDPVLDALRFFGAMLGTKREGRTLQHQSASQPLPNQPHGHLEDTDWTEVLSYQLKQAWGSGHYWYSNGGPPTLQLPLLEKASSYIYNSQVLHIPRPSGEHDHEITEIPVWLPPYCVPTRVRHGLVADKALHGHLNSIVMTLPARPCSHFLLSSLQGCNQTVDLSLFLSVSLSLSLFAFSVSSYDRTDLAVICIGRCCQNHKLFSLLLFKR